MFQLQTKNKRENKKQSMDFNQGNSISWEARMMLNTEQGEVAVNMLFWGLQVNINIINLQRSRGWKGETGSGRPRKSFWKKKNNNIHTRMNLQNYFIL